MGKFDAGVGWCMLSISISSGVIAAWETSAAIVTQSYFRWGVTYSSVFIAGSFLFSMAMGEMQRLMLGKISLPEAKVVFCSYFIILIASASLYWYIPSVAPPASRIINEVMYVLGSGFVLAGANTARTYSTTIGMRRALAIGKTMKDRASVWQATSQSLGRAFCALLGMYFATLSGGANIAAGIVTAVAGMMTFCVLWPGFYASLCRV